MKGMTPSPTARDFEVVTDDDRRLAKANGVLFARLKAHLLGKDMTQQLYDSMLTLIGDHRFECNMRGIAYPQVVAVWLDGICAVKLVRADIDAQNLQTAIVNWTREHPTITVDEIVRALKRHFPGYVSHVNSETKH
jgi:hypothetical protein